MKIETSVCNYSKTSVLSVYIGKFFIDLNFHPKSWSTPHIHLTFISSFDINLSLLCFSVDFSYGYTWEELHGHSAYEKNRED